MEISKGLTTDNPYTHAPEDWHENGVPYGAFCKCHECGYVGRSTIIFDYYAKNAGGPLCCETCRIGTPKATEMVMRDRVSDERLEPDGSANEG